MDDSSLARLRNQALDATRARDWPSLLALEGQLRADSEIWTQVWGPACAVAARLTDRADARALLEECVQGGFYQLDNLGAEAFDQAFGPDQDWPAMRARILANVPLPRVELICWPVARPILPLQLTRLDAAGEERLAARLPGRLTGAWGTAQMLLRWVSDHWRHSGMNHDGSGDANVVLDRVGLGERFACKEYTLVLTQALNAVQIPARQVGLFRPDYHAGLGGAHAVTEAWIDDLGKWVVLDGQNGAVWRDESGVPLGVLELQRRYRDGDQPQFDGAGHNFIAEAAADWFRHFHVATVPGRLAWSASRFVPILEQSRVITCERLADGDEDVAADLSAVSTGLTDDGGPALAFSTDHPYATGLEVTSTPGGPPVSLRQSQSLRLASEPGEYELSVAVRTPYCVLGQWPLRYLVR